jgi:hypothetical protein
MSSVADDLIAAVLRFTVSLVVLEMLRDLDVTDDVLGRGVHRQVHARLGKGKGPASTEMAAVFSPIEAMRVAAGGASKIRRSAALAVAVLLDEDPGADERSIAQWVQTALVHEFGEGSEERLTLDFAHTIGRSYAAMCRRSGLAPEQWAEAFTQSVRDGRWAFGKA